MKKIISAVSLVFLFGLVFVEGHGNILYGIDLDFDKAMKLKIIEAAQSYLGINEEPVQFDFDRELIVVKFDRELEYFVSINPVDYSVSGFRDDELLNRNAEIKYNQQQRKEIAQKIFDSLPEEYKSEMAYGEEEKLYSGSFKYRWYRYVDDIFVSNKYFEVEVDGSRGDVIAWKRTIFFYPKSQIQTTPAITYQVAQKIAEIRFKATPLDYKPILILERGKPVWITKVKSLFPFFVGVDALDGNVLYSGSLRTELPENYDYGREVEVIETDFIKNIYNDQG